MTHFRIINTQNHIDVHCEFRQIRYRYQPIRPPTAPIIHNETFSKNLSTDRGLSGLFAVPASAAFSSIDDFEFTSDGDIETAQNGWTGDSSYVSWICLRKPSPPFHRASTVPAPTTMSPQNYSLRLHQWHRHPFPRCDSFEPTTNTLLDSIFALVTEGSPSSSTGDMEAYGGVVDQDGLLDSDLVATFSEAMAASILVNLSADTVQHLDGR